MLLLFIWKYSNIMAQLPDFHVQLLDERNGIQTGNITGIIRDKQGFLWLLSARNLQRFDGQNVKKIETDDEDFLDITTDSSGTIWVTTELGIKKYVNNYVDFRRARVESPGADPLRVGPPDAGPPNKFNKLQVTPDNRIWANARKGLYLYEAHDDKFKHYFIPGLSPKIQFYRRIFSRRNYQMYLADVHTIFLYDAKKNTTRVVPFENVRTVTPFSDDVAWVTNSMLITYEVNFRTESVTPVAGLPVVDMKSITPLGNNNYLVNTRQGCYKYNRNSKIFSKAILYHSGKKLPNEETYTDYYDRDSTLWILCEEGIAFFRPREHNIGWLRGYAGAGKKWNNNIHAITEDKNGNIWLGTAGGFTKMNFKTGEVKTIYANAAMPNTFKHPWVRSLVFDGKNLVVGASVGEPVIFIPELETFKRMVFPVGNKGIYLRKKLEKDLISGLLTMQNGDQLILGEESCYVLEKDTYEVSEKIFKGSVNNIQTAVQEKSGNLWMGSYNGLLYVDKGFRTQLYDDQFLPGKLVSSLLIRNDSTVWCGSVGLFEVVRTKNVLRKKSLFPQLRNQTIAILFEDKKGKIWIGADNGLYRFDEKTKKLEWFDGWDNVQNKRFNAHSLLESKDGNVYLGGLNGLNYFNPEKIKTREEKLNVIISGVTINQDDSSFISGAETTQLNWKQNSVEFQFVTPYFGNAQKLIYRYQLIGLDNGWQMNGRNNKVRFSSLSPNEYVFTVAASLDGVKWYETGKRFKFVISPPFWQRAWFIILCVIAAGALAYWIFKKRVTIIRKQTALREKFNEMEMRALRAQMNPHFIFNCLNSINRYIVKNDNATASLYLTRFSKLIRLILDNSNSKNVLLSNELEALKLYIEMEGVRFDNKFDYRIILDENVYPDSIEVPSLIIQPYVENAIWHGLLHKETNGSLLVQISMQGENVLQCIIEDDGIGRAKAMEYRSKSAMNKKSLGMKLTEDRIAILNQDSKTNASVKIQDLVDDSGEAAGTRVVIVIPV
ncbi:sensor histidine kinase [Dyadobacter sp. NIV53]|uniref:sensor histidine kinase n=1 Tax=Dyadobacter sp. NIV53 TaxID=2861765 RepID=UPI001C8896FE|nr:sensor histidine kinase [Dyadobacter sp. NIV53]